MHKQRTSSLMRFQEAACHIAPGCAFDDCKDPEPKLPDTQDGLATRAKDQSLEASLLFQMDFRKPHVALGFAFVFDVYRLL